MLQARSVLLPQPARTIDNAAAFTLGLAANQVQIQRHENVGQRQPRDVVARMTLRAQWRLHRSRNDAVDAKACVVFPFIGEDREKRRQTRFGDRVSAPESRGLLAARVEGKCDARVRCGAQKWDQRAREAKRRQQIHAQGREPAVERLMLDGPERAELHRGMNDGVDPAVLRLKRAGHRPRNPRRSRSPDQSGRMVGSGWPASAMRS